MSEAQGTSGIWVSFGRSVMEVRWVNAESRSNATAFVPHARHARFSSALVYMVRRTPARRHLATLPADILEDAVPKKRGPKTDVLEALLKRVDGLEARLKDKKTEPDSESPENAAENAPEASTSTQATSSALAGVRAEIDQELEDTKMFSPTQPR